MEYITIGDLVKTGEVEITTGPFGTQLKASEYRPEGTPVVNVKNIGFGSIVRDKLDRVGDETVQRLQRHILREGDIVFGRKGAVERHSYITEDEDGWMQGSDCIRLRVKSNRFSPQFFSYCFLTKQHRDFMIRMCSHGTTMASLNQGILELIKVPSFDYLSQNKIAEMLRTIDDKIETNKRINDILSYQLQTIYNQMFSKSLKDSERGGQLKDICLYSQRRVLVSSLTIDTYYSTENMLPGKKGAVAAMSLPTTAQTVGCMPGDVLVSNIRPYFMKIVYCQSECGCSADVLCFVPKESALSQFLFCTLYDDHFFDYMVAGSKGTKMPRGDKQQIMVYPVVIPSSEQLERFNSFAHPVLDKVESNVQENKRLSSIRATLLPRLMSGEIDVSNIAV